MKESTFERDFCKRLRDMDPKNVFTLKGSSGLKQGFPDRLIMYRDRHAYLEFKKKDGAKEQPNQRYYIEHLGQHCYSSFVFPENGERVFDEVVEYLGIKDVRH